MKVSVIIPTRNSKAYIESLLIKLNNQTVSPHEIIIINTKSQDDIENICKKYKNVKFIEISQNEFDHGGTRNRAAKKAVGDILVFMTQDAYPKNNKFIEEIVSPLGKENIVCSYGRQLPREDSGVVESFSRSFNYPDKDIVKSKEDIDMLGVKTFFFSNVCSAFIKDEFWRIGGFPEETIMNEDMIIASKFIFDNKKSYYASKAMVIHSHKYSYIQQFKRNFDIGVVFVDSREYFKEIKSESEGIKFVKEAIKYLINNKKAYLIPHLIIETGFRFLGYKVGQHYKKIPLKYVKRMSMHSFYFDKKQVRSDLDEDINNRGEGSIRKAN
ncbi:glycosyltransferase family 2 protein [Romboutsia maritimum]|uniref:Glycosyltransferase family 2 protein n=1 Tax=Romboutsia maritimum TaxID=2020948 RepID=A0A371IS17_9FIRM|nr:glycosyltransferase family 2 protein [Romboutsia maritimum]RDY23278.1 glycosyltransferase family 2 protein [Romboutsia maritimum]